MGARSTERILILVLFIAICSMSFGQTKPTLNGNDQVRVQKPQMGKKVEQEGKAAVEKLEQDGKEVLDQVKDGNVDGAKEKVKGAKGKVKGAKDKVRGAKDKVENVNVKPANRVDKPSKGDVKPNNGEHIDGEQRGKPVHDKHEGHDHGSHEGHDHGDKKGKGHNKADGHPGKGKGHAYGRLNDKQEQRVNENRQRMNKVDISNRQTEGRMQQAKQALDMKLEKGEITKEDYAAKKERLEALNTRMIEVQKKKAEQQRKMQELEAPKN